MPFRIMTYNVRYFGHFLRGAGSTRHGVEAIASAIATLDDPPDLICLQEVETRSLRSRLCHTPGREDETQLDLLMRLLEEALEKNGRRRRDSGFYFPAHTYKIRSTVLYTTGLAILAADGVELDDHNAAKPQDITHRRIARVAHLKQSRICAHARFRHRDGQLVDVFNTHLSLPAFATKEFFNRDPNMGYGQNQKAEVESLASFIERTRANDRFVVLGDFNSLPASPAYERFVERAGVKDPFPRILGCEAAELRRAWPTAGFLNLRMRLDHVFVGPGLDCLDADDSHPFGAPGRWTGLSDHVPLLLRLKSNGFTGNRRGG